MDKGWVEEGQFGEFSRCCSDFSDDAESDSVEQLSQERTNEEANGFHFIPNPNYDPDASSEPSEDSDQDTQEAAPVLDMLLKRGLFSRPRKPDLADFIISGANKDGSRCELHLGEIPQHLR